MFWVQKTSIYLVLFFLLQAQGAKVIAEEAMDSPVNAGASSDYKVTAGDVLLVSVWDEPELTAEVVVLPDHTISFPLVGVLDVSATSVSEIRETLTRKLTTYIPEAHVHVALQQIRGSKFYVIGKVNRPGEFPLERETTVLQALSVAGGLNAFADEDGVKVIRSSEKTQQAIVVEYSALMKGKTLESNIALKSGDVVVVP